MRFIRVFVPEESNPNTQNSSKKVRIFAPATAFASFVIDVIAGKIQCKKEIYLRIWINLSNEEKKRFYFYFERTYNNQLAWH